jgi:hypothetical protein
VVFALQLELGDRILLVGREIANWTQQHRRADLVICSDFRDAV